MGVYSNKCARGWGVGDTDFFPGTLGRMRNFGGNVEEILQFQGVLWGNFDFGGTFLIFCPPGH